MMKGMIFEEPFLASEIGTPESKITLRLAGE